MKNNKYICNISQLFNVKEYRMLGGRAEGLRALDVDNGKGLVFSVLADRAMDFGRITFKGKNLNFVTPAGYVAPEYYDGRGVEFLKSFGAGFLTTCGLQSMGNPNVDGGREHGLHGAISNIPAEQFGAKTTVDENGVATVKMSGVMREARLGAENLILEREIVCKSEENAIYFTDTIENLGDVDMSVMTLYHFNYGYPLIDENAEIVLPSKEVKARNADAVPGLGEWHKLQPPTPGYAEQCFYHKLKSDECGRSIYGVFNHELGIGAFVEYDTKTLDHFLEWKLMGEGNYVLGLEPANATLEGRETARADGSMKYLAPGEKIVNRFKIVFADGEAEFDAIKAYIATLK